MPRLQPRPLRQPRRRNWRSGPSGSETSGASRSISLARRARHQSAKVQVSGSSFSCQDSLRKLPRQKQPVSGHEPAALGQRAMRGNEIRSRDAIAVEKDAIIAGGGKDRAVADFGKAEAIIGMPDMVQAAFEPRLPQFDQFFGRLGGTVIGDQHLEV